MICFTLSVSKLEHTRCKYIFIIFKIPDSQQLLSQHSEKILNSDRVVRVFWVFFFALWSNLSGYSFVFVSLPVEHS